MGSPEWSGLRGGPARLEGCPGHGSVGTCESLGPQPGLKAPGSFSCGGQRGGREKGGEGGRGGALPGPGSAGEAGQGPASLRAPPPPPAGPAKGASSQALGQRPRPQVHPEAPLPVCWGERDPESSEVGAGGEQAQPGHHAFCTEDGDYGLDLTGPGLRPRLSSTKEGPLATGGALRGKQASPPSRMNPGILGWERSGCGWWGLPLVPGHHPHPVSMLGDTWGPSCRPPAGPRALSPPSPSLMAPCTTPGRGRAGRGAHFTDKEPEPRAWPVLAGTPAPPGLPGFSATFDPWLLPWEESGDFSNHSTALLRSMGHWAAPPGGRNMFQKVPPTHELLRRPRSL